MRVERAIVELRRGRPIEVRDPTGITTIAALETLDGEELAGFLTPSGWLHLVITAERAASLGLSSRHHAVDVTLPPNVTPDRLAMLVGLETAARTDEPAPHAVQEADARTEAGLTLARLGQLIPAVVWTVTPPNARDGDRLWVTPQDVEAYPAIRGRELQRVSRARVPLAAHEHCEFVVYRERFGDAEHVAIIIGRPEREKAPLVRLHSACLTGDLLSSLRCDCGDQLRDAVVRIAESGGGVVLYLAHEGRGIGLANKLRAYTLQDAGLDTLEADQHLGFRSDERDYTAACAMLKDLELVRIRLLTNNPGKITALEADGIEVIGRESLPGRVNPHNARYLRTKRERAGHLDTQTEGLDSD